MNFRNTIAFFLVAAVLTVSSAFVLGDKGKGKKKCPIPGFTLAESGTCFKVHKTGKGIDLPLDSEMIFMNMKFVNFKDSVLYDFSINPETGEPYALMMRKASFKGDIYDMIRKYHAGDSVTVYMLLDTLKVYYPNEFKLQPPLDTMKYAGFSFRIDSIWNKKRIAFEKAMYEKMRAEEQAKQNKIMAVLGPLQQQAHEQEPLLKQADAELLKTYLTEHHVTTAPDSRGMYFIETTPGVGDPLVPGTPIGVRYKGMYLNGTIFDANTLLPDIQPPLRFRVGIDPMIEGFTSGCLRMKKGSKATLIIPPAMGYGDGLTRVFEVEVVEVGNSGNRNAQPH